MPTPPSVGSFVKDRMHAADLTQAELAAKMRMSRLTVNELVNSKRRITATTAQRLAKHLGSTPEWWMDRQRDVDLYRVEMANGAVK